MRIRLLTVGKTDIPWVREGLEMYLSRLEHYASFSLEEIPELKNVSSMTQEQIKHKEGELILKTVRPRDRVILLDEHGKEYRSLEFAAQLSSWMQAGRDLLFVIGGAYGFSPQVYSRADGKLSISPMTFSHQLVRTIFAEQLYRAFTILRGEPYHHE